MDSPFCVGEIIIVPADSSQVVRMHMELNATKSGEQCAHLT